MTQGERFGEPVPIERERVMCMSCGATTTLDQIHTGWAIVYDEDRDATQVVAWLCPTCDLN